MIVKRRDALPQTLTALERRAARERDPSSRAACLAALSRLRAGTTSKAACALLDHQFGEAPDWAVLHDLRLQIGNHAVHLNHLLINDGVACVCIDSRYLDYGLQRLPDGRCEVYSPLGSQLIASPLVKASRDARMVATLLSKAGLLPRVLGIGPRATVSGVVVTNPGLRVGLAATPAEGSAMVMASDSLFPSLWRRRRRRVAGRFDRLSQSRLETLATRLAALHRPCWPTSLLDDEASLAVS